MPNQLGTTVDLNEAKLIFSSAEHVGHYDADLRLRLLQALQTTLDLQTLFNLFFDHTQSAVAFDGFTYHLDQMDIELQFGKQSLHSCNYRLITQKDYLGELTFYRSRRFPEKDLAVLESLLNIIVFPLRNAILYNEAVSAALVDPLTGVGNKIALQSTLTREIELAHRFEQPLAMVMLDLNNFNQINERHGHQYGNQLLKHLVGAVKEVMGSKDALFRLSGEEFILLMPNTTLESARYTAERLRQVGNHLGPVKNDIPVDTSINLGLSMLQANDTAKRLQDRAAYAMYCAKHDGRGQVKICAEQACPT